MSFTETGTVVSSIDTDEFNRDVRQRKTACIDESFQLPAVSENRSRRICRRHSYAFRCTENGTQGSRDEGKHDESVLLVKVSSFDMSISNRS